MSVPDRAIHANDGSLIGVVTRPARGRFFAHSIHRHHGESRRFRTRWEAATWIHAVHANEMGWRE